MPRTQRILKNNIPSIISHRQGFHHDIVTLHVRDAIRGEQSNTLGVSRIPFMLFVEHRYPFDDTSCNKLAETGLEKTAVCPRGI